MIEPIRVGQRAPDGATGCTYSIRPGVPPCGADITVHVLTMDPNTGEPAFLTSCDEHAGIARQLGADSHPFDAEDCMFVTTWIFTVEGERVGRCIA